MRLITLISPFLFLGSYIFPAYTYASPQNANALVSGILSYTSWDSDISQLNFCMMDGPAKFISPDIFTPPSPLIRPNQIKILQLKTVNIVQNLTSLNQYHCHVLYFANTDDSIQNSILKNYQARILSISEQNTDCVMGSAFCLYLNQNKYTFKVNLNSLKKSNIRVNSKVLMLANPEGE